METQVTASNDTHCADCGAEFVPSGITTGYGTDPKTSVRYCFACCGKRDRASMIETGKATLYLSGPPASEARYPAFANGTHALPGYKITNWPGTLTFNVGGIKRSAHNLARWRYDVWFAGPDGQTWHGVQYGDNTQIVHCRRTKAK